MHFPKAQINKLNKKFSRRFNLPQKNLDQVQFVFSSFIFTTEKILIYASLGLVIKMIMKLMITFSLETQDIDNQIKGAKANI